MHGTSHAIQRKKIISLEKKTWAYFFLLCLHVCVSVCVWGGGYRWKGAEGGACLLHMITANLHCSLFSRFHFIASLIARENLVKFLTTKCGIHELTESTTLNAPAWANTSFPKGHFPFTDMLYKTLVSIERGFLARHTIPILTRPCLAYNNRKQ